jgi:phosphoribosylaminoimidazole-succinocarboxamide synthase
MVAESTLRAALPMTLEKTALRGLGELYDGKVRDCYVGNSEIHLVATDRLSAFDQIITTLPFKGQVLNRLSAWWFQKTASIVPNHLLSGPDPNVSRVARCEPLPVELVVRAYVTGVTSTSIWTAYDRGERVFCGNRLPEGLRKNEKLPAPILTPSTKAPKGQHDKSVSRDEILAEGRISAKDFDRCAEMAMTLFAEGTRIAGANGIILVDTKYEVGRLPNGQIVIMDEIHTPDSSRFWYRDSYETSFAAGKDPEGLDKEYVRRWLSRELNYKGDGPPPAVLDEVRVEAARRYIEAYERLTGETFEPNLEDPAVRLPRNLGVA